MSSSWSSPLSIDLNSQINKTKTKNKKHKKESESLIHKPYVDVFSYIINGVF